MADDDEKHCGGKDVIQLGPDLGDGARTYVRHRDNCTLETGIMRPHADGAPIGSADGLVQLEAREGEDVYDVTTLYERTREPGTGPAKVSNDAFRSGWDRVFGSKVPVGQA